MQNTALVIHLRRFFHILKIGEEYSEETLNSVGTAVALFDQALSSQKTHLQLQRDALLVSLMLILPIGESPQECPGNSSWGPCLHMSLPRISSMSSWSCLSSTSSTAGRTTRSRPSRIWAYTQTDIQTCRHTAIQTYSIQTRGHAVCQAVKWWCNWHIAACERDYAPHAKNRIQGLVKEPSVKR